MLLLALMNGCKILIISKKLKEIMAATKMFLRVRRMLPISRQERNQEKVLQEANKTRQIILFIVVIKKIWFMQRSLFRPCDEKRKTGSFYDNWVYW